MVALIGKWGHAWYWEERRASEELLTSRERGKKGKIPIGRNRRMMDWRHRDRHACQVKWLDKVDPSSWNSFIFQIYFFKAIWPLGLHRDGSCYRVRFYQVIPQSHVVFCGHFSTDRSNAMILSNLSSSMFIEIFIDFIEFNRSSSAWTDTMPSLNLLVKLWEAITDTGKCPSCTDLVALPPKSPEKSTQLLNSVLFLTQKTWAFSSWKFDKITT